MLKRDNDARKCGKWECYTLRCVKMWMGSVGVDLLTLKMTLNHKNNIRNGLSSQNYTKKVLHLFLRLFVEISYFTFKLTLTLDSAPAPPPS